MCCLALRSTLVLPFLFICKARMPTGLILTAGFPFQLTLRGGSAGSHQVRFQKLTLSRNMSDMTLFELGSRDFRPHQYAVRVSFRVWEENPSTTEDSDSALWAHVLLTLPSPEATQEHWY